MDPAERGQARLTSSPLLEVHNLVVERDGRTILDIPHLTIYPGEVLSLIGPNGAGKTTLLHCLNLLIRPTRGELFFEGQAIQRADGLAVRRQMSLVMQEPLLLNTSVRNNVATGLRLRSLPRSEIRQRVDTWLDRLGIRSLEKRSAARLSGGEAQRVSLARALVLNPKVLFLDEPFSSLDAPSRAQFLLDLHRLLKEGQQTSVFVTHDRDEALQLSDRIAVLIQGKLRQVGLPQEVFSSPADPEVANFVGIETVIPARVEKVDAGVVTVSASGQLLQAVSKEGVDLQPGAAVLFCIRPEDITLSILSSSAASSARNSLDGQIVQVIAQGPLTRVYLQCGFSLIALITRASAEEMSLHPGMPIHASFKASSTHLIQI